MRNDYFAGIAGMVKKVALLAPGAIAANGNSGGVDISAFQGQALICAAIFNTAGTNPTMNVKLQHSAAEPAISAESYTGTGNGTITEIEGGPDAVAETFTITLTSATAFGVTGSVSGALAAGVVGTKYSVAQVSFMITAGGTAFINTDAFVFTVAARVYADVTGGAFTQVTNTKSLTYKAFNADELGRYLRLNFVIGGTVAPSYLIGVNIFGFTQ
jgi:hypothetical protein